MHNHFLIVALDLARERAAEADRYRLAALARSGKPRASRLFRARRLVARIAAAVARTARSEPRRSPARDVVTRRWVASHHDN
jgi:hypothetical protein